jgi:hypothetical protein
VKVKIHIVAMFGNFNGERKYQSRAWWLIPIILATWEAEIRRRSHLEASQVKKLIKPHLNH